MFEFMFIIVPILPIIFFGIFITVIVSVIKTAKRHGQITKSVTTIAMEKLNSANEQEPKQEKPNYCDYCGSVFEKNKTKCPNCGAKVRK